MSFAGLSIGWSFCGYLAVVIAMAALLHHLRGMPRFFSLICLPGTVGHELLHFLVGTITMAKPVRVSALWLVYCRSAQIPPLSWGEITWTYVAASLTVSCLPSRADVAIVWSEPAGVFFYLAGAAILCWACLRMLG